MAVLGPCLCAKAFPSRGKRGPPLITVRGSLTIAASPVAEHRLQTRRLSNCGSRAQPLRGMWVPPRPGLEPMSPAPAGRLSTTAPPGKPLKDFFLLFPIFKWNILSEKIFVWSENKWCSRRSMTSDNRHSLVFWESLCMWIILDTNNNPETALIYWVSFPWHVCTWRMLSHFS